MRYATVLERRIQGPNRPELSIYSAKLPLPQSTLASRPPWSTGLHPESTDDLVVPRVMVVLTGDPPQSSSQSSTDHSIEPAAGARQSSPSFGSAVKPAAVNRTNMTTPADGRPSSTGITASRGPRVGEFLSKLTKRKIKRRISGYRPANAARRESQDVVDSSTYVSAPLLTLLPALMTSASSGVIGHSASTSSYDLQGGKATSKTE